MTKGSSAARQDLRKRRGLSKLEQGYMGFVLILPWLIGFCIFKRILAGVQLYGLRSV